MTPKKVSWGGYNEHRRLICTIVHILLYISVKDLMENWHCPHCDMEWPVFVSYRSWRNINN